MTSVGDLIGTLLRMSRWEGTYFLATFVILSIFTSCLRAEEPAWIPKDARSYQSIEDKGTDQETFRRATVCRMRDGKFYVAVWAPPPRHEWKCDGMGELGKDGWIHFSWLDNFSRKGTGAVRFLDHETKLAVNTDCQPGNSPSDLFKNSWILPWTRKPVLVDVRTSPHGYLIQLPAAYENREEDFNYLTLLPQSGGRVRIVGSVHLIPQGSDRSSVVLITTGVWQNGDQLVFSLNDDQTKNRGKGIIHFLSPDKVVLTLTYISSGDPKKKAQAQEFNALNLTLLRNGDRKPWQIAGVGEEMER